MIAAKNMAKHISNFALENEVPLLTFVEDVCLGSANIILASGYKSYASKKKG